MSISEQKRLAKLKPSPSERQDGIISAIEKRIRASGGDATDFAMAVAEYYHHDEINREHATRLGLLKWGRLTERFNSD